MKTLSAEVKISGLTLIKNIILITLLAGVHQASAQAAQFFRISGPAATKIIAFRTDGSLVWSNALAGTNYTVQTATSLAGGNHWVDYVTIPVTSKINTNQIIAVNPVAGMAFMPAGEFTMGNSIGDSDITDANSTNVYVSAFSMDVNLVSLNQWAGVYSYATNHGYVFFLYNMGFGKAGNHPVWMVTWYDCVNWCNARSAQAGLTPVYYTDPGFTQLFTNAGNSATVLYVDWGANGYRLPTEAEWEKAARGGLSGQRFPFGNTISDSQANYQGNTNSYSYDLGPNGYNSIGSVGGTSPATSPVGSFAANGYGLNDMAGNVSEWCWDWYASPPYSTGSPYLGGTDPHGSASNDAFGDGRVLRGGSWLFPAAWARCAYRMFGDPLNTDNDTAGFRCVRGH
jgi:sulfatase modifying factor 1